MDEYAVDTRAHTGTRPGALKRWMIEHEDRPSFLFLYVAAAVVLSIVISLFWLAVVVVLHLLFEIMRFSTQKDRTGRVVGEALWEVKLDASLILIALALAVYIDAVFGVLGLSTAARAAGASARFVALQRALRGILISMDDALLVGRGIMKRFGGRKKTMAASPGSQVEAPAETASPPSPGVQEEEPAHGHQEHDDVPSWRTKWGTLDWATFVISVVSLGLLVAAPWLTHHDYSSALHELRAELHPWPSDSPLQGWIDRGMAWMRG